MDDIKKWEIQFQNCGKFSHQPISQKRNWEKHLQVDEANKFLPSFEFNQLFSHSKATLQTHFWSHPHIDTFKIVYRKPFYTFIYRKKRLFIFPIFAVDLKSTYGKFIYFYHICRKNSFFCLSEWGFFLYMKMEWMRDILIIGGFSKGMLRFSREESLNFSTKSTELTQTDRLIQRRSLGLTMNRGQICTFLKTTFWIEPLKPIGCEMLTIWVFPRYKSVSSECEASKSTNCLK